MIDELSARRRAKTAARQQAMSHHPSMAGGAEFLAYLGHCAALAAERAEHERRAKDPSDLKVVDTDGT